MALFENYDRRIDKINGVLKQYGIESVEACREMCQAKGFDPYEIVKGIQPICFENACWAYTVGAAIAIAGVVLVVLNGQLTFHLNPLGDLIALAAALMWAVYSILIKKYTEQYDNFLVTRRVMLWAFITAVPLMLLTDGMPDLHPLFTQTNVLLSWLFLGVFGNAVCFAIWNIAFQRLGVVITNNYLYASPFVTLVVGYLLLDEQITVMSVIGAVLITVGVIVALKKPKERT